MNKRTILFSILIVCFSFIVNADDKHRLHLARQLSIYNNIIKELNLFYVDSIMPEKMRRKCLFLQLPDIRGKNRHHR